MQQHYLVTVCVALALLVAAALPGVLYAQERGKFTDLTGRSGITVDDIVKALAPVPANHSTALTRGAKIVGPGSARLDMSSIAPPRLAMAVTFASNSDVISPQAYADLNTLGRALSGPSTRGAISRGAVLVPLPEKTAPSDAKPSDAKPSDAKPSDTNAAGLRIAIEGHTDSVGSEWYNQLLSERRAASIKRYLEERFQLASTDLVARGYGKNRPIDSNDTETGRRHNRRVEIVNLSQ